VIAILDYGMGNVRSVLNALDPARAGRDPVVTLVATMVTDTQNKRYSDGMQARLSFAIAIIFPAHIYLFDEVLAVVDDEFRARCLAEIAGLVAAGRTVIFVSHDLDQVRQVCTQAAWLQKGVLRALGPTEEVAQQYSAAPKAEIHA